MGHYGGRLKSSQERGEGAPGVGELSGSGTQAATGAALIEQNISFCLGYTTVRYGRAA